LESGNIMKLKKSLLLAIVGTSICGLGIVTVKAGKESGVLKKSGPPFIPTFKRPQPFGYSEGSDLVSDYQMLSVVRIIDGDTIVVKQHGIEKTIRLIGVDTPELTQRQYYAHEATMFMRNLLVGEKVYLKTDLKTGLIDKYGRTLAYVYRMPDGLFVNAELVRQGYSPAYLKFPFEYQPKFYELEKFAKYHKKGLWAFSPQK